jgi:hypothetical protein
MSSTDCTRSSLDSPIQQGFDFCDTLPKPIAPGVIGSKFGNWTVLGPGRTDRAREMWRCRCDCGHVANMRATRLRSGQQIPCGGCEDALHRTPLRLETFGLWTVISEGRDERGRWRWLCHCKCGRPQYISPTHLIRGATKGCRRCSPLKHPSGIPANRWSKIVSSAKRRDIEVSISREEAYSLLEAQDFKCALTGMDIWVNRRSWDSKRNSWTASIDRIDSKKPYEVGNIQWVHKDVNLMKNDLSQERFIELCRKVTEKHTCESKP